MLYLFVLGRDPELSKVEIESLLESKEIDFKIVDESKKVVVCDCKELDPKIIDEFGGIIKIARVISSSNRFDQIESNLDKEELYKGTKNKIEYFIDEFSTNLTSLVVDYLKDYFKKIEVKALYKKKNEPSKLVNRNIVEEGLNLVIFKSYIGKTIAVTNPLELKRRDLNRPEVDYKKVISIRLAKILVNLTKVKPNETLLDPFCGSGTILQEALLKSINVVGLDNDVTTIDQAKANLEWLSKTYHVKDNYKLINVDCRELANQLKGKIINGVASEPYMGPFIRKLPTISQARGLVEELTELYTTLLRGLKQVVKKGGRVVIVIPRFKTRENTVVFLDFRDMAENSGFSIALKPIAYGYAENKLLREIYVLENN